MKKSIATTVNIDIIRPDRTFHKIWKSVASPAFFANAIQKFGHYSNPVGYMENRYCYLLGHKPDLDALIALGKEEVIIDLIEIEKTDITQFLIAFLSKEHKELRCTAELLRLILQYIKTPEGKIWFSASTDSRDKEVQLATILGITCYAVKCYLKLLQPGNERYLELLADFKNYSLSKAYNECLANERKPQTTDKDANATSKDNNSKERSETPKPSGDFATEESDDDFFSSFEDENDAHTVVNSETKAPAPTAAGEDESDDDRRQVMFNKLEKYRRNTGSEPEPDVPNSLPLNSIASKVIVVLYDASLLELNGEIELCVDGSTVNSTSQLQKLPDGNWSLHKQHKTLSLTINSKIAA